MRGHLISCTCTLNCNKSGDKETTPRYKLLLSIHSVYFQQGTNHVNILYQQLKKWFNIQQHLDRVKRIWYLSPMRAAKVQASLRIRAVSPEPSLLAHTSSESRGTFRQKARSVVPLNGWACAVKICHDGMLEDTNSLDGAHLRNNKKC